MVRGKKKPARRLVKFLTIELGGESQNLKPVYASHRTNAAKELTEKMCIIHEKQPYLECV